MIIKDQTTQKFAGSALFLYLTGAALVGFVLMVGFSYIRPQGPEPEEIPFPTISCDMETIDTIGADNRIELLGLITCGTCRIPMKRPVELFAIV